jgi:serine/threonine protein kinase
MSEEDGLPKDRNPNLSATESSSNPSVDPDLVPTMASSASGLTGATATALESKSIGPYKLLHRLGVGGMGQVWLAEQTAPVQRQVALKLIKVGRYDDELLLRFRSEGQSLAMMDHLAIAKIFDAGATPDGQPYFVMEYVPGVPITKPRATNWTR